MSDKKLSMLEHMVIDFLFDGWALGLFFAYMGLHTTIESDKWLWLGGAGVIFISARVSQVQDQIKLLNKKIDALTTSLEKKGADK